MDAPVPADRLSAVGTLAEPTRRRLYEFVSSRHAPVGRDEAAAGTGIGRKLAAFHLDRLVDAGLLRVEYRRLTGRSGPGAGRPAKLYARVPGEVAVSLPERRYGLAADVLATAIEQGAEGTRRTGVLEVARARGARIAAAAGNPAGGAGALVACLERSGYEPETGSDAATIRLRNCPFDALLATHRELTCSMNLALLQGLTAGFPDARAEPVFAPSPDACCVELRVASDPADGARRHVSHEPPPPGSALDPR